jgi:Bacterial regulatory protein, Fis family
MVRLVQLSPHGQEGTEVDSREVPLHEAMSAFKRSLVLQALTAKGGNRSQAAAALQIERTSLLRLIRELGIEGLPDASRGRPPASRKPLGQRNGARRARPLTTKNVS